MLKSLLNHLLSLSTPRTDAPTTLPDPAVSGFSCEDDKREMARKAAGGLTAAEGDDRSIEPVLQAFLHVAFLRDYHHANPLARPAILRRYVAIENRAEAVNYIQEVAARVPKPKKHYHSLRLRPERRQ